MKKIKTLIILFLAVILTNASVFAQVIDDPEYIKVGLLKSYKDISSFTIKNKNLEFGYFLNDAFNIYGSWVFSSDALVKSSHGYFVRVDEVYTSYYDAQVLSEAYVSMGYSSGVGVKGPNEYYVYLGEYTEDEAKNVLSTVVGVTILPPQNGRTVIYDGTKIIAIFDDVNDVVIKDSGNIPIKIDSHIFRGMVSPHYLSNNNFTIVNIVPFEEYLYGVIPSEMPQAWNIEALKAQTVSARTYAVSALHKHEDEGFNVCDLVHCQVYLGYSNESERTTTAVNETKGLKAYYNNQLINAVFSSSSGGATANSEDVWLNTVEYLREKKDPYDTTGKNWERKLTLDDLTNLLSINGVNIGSATAIEITKLSKEGRVNELVIHGTSGDKKLVKEEIRYFFADGIKPSLESRVFTISGDNITSSTTTTTTTNVTYHIYVYGASEAYDDLSAAYAISSSGTNMLDKKDVTLIGENSIKTYEPTMSINSNTEKINGDFTITGKGYGHGVGLSQHGANGMANQGFSFIDILKFYYDGIEVK